LIRRDEYSNRFTGTGKQRENEIFVSFISTFTNPMIDGMGPFFKKAVIKQCGKRLHGNLPDSEPLAGFPSQKPRAHPSSTS